MLNTLTTTFVRRLRDRDESAWFELWETFGPVLRAQLAKWGKGRIGVETVRDLTQETLAALSDSIDRYDPARGARFSTWLLSIAKHALGDEIDRRQALKRGAGKRPTELDERFMSQAATVEADDIYQQRVFCAKVYAAIRKAESEADFMQFQVYRMRVFDGKPGKQVAESLGISEPTVSRHLQRVRDVLRKRLSETVALYSFTVEESSEAERAGLGKDDLMFDEALCEVYHRQSRLILDDEAAVSARFTFGAARLSGCAPVGARVMGTDNLEVLLSILGVVAGITLFVLAMVFVAVPLFKGVGWGINSIFRFIGWLVMHIFEFVAGVLGDCVRFIGSLLVMLILLPLVPVNVVIGRWSAAGHFAERFKNELAIGAACVYRAVIRRPLRFLLLDGVLEGLEQRLPDAMAGAPGSDRPSHRMGQFDGYNIVGSLRAGGSGAKLYVAQPDAEKLRKFANMPDRVVIKAFALTEGSSLPQIVRESRALECAKQLGHVLDHGMDDHRFFYVMPYHPGEHLGVLTRQFHAECGGRGLDRKHLNLVMSYTRDLLATLTAYHKCGLWHKDVKPENVIVHDDAAHLVDLGLVTPLRSAMTLTTHGTEYFRDPEMVRQALRGVKVHQVDGAKFDIYAAGAVLYFMLENTFPAHGGLSRITMPSPEALRWIVRRSMTEYNQRYETADEMLRDLAHVMSASDVYAVKPADLPSMGGASAVPAAAESVDPVTAVMNAAGAAVGSAVAAIGAAFGAAAPAEAGAAAGAAPAADKASKCGTNAGKGAKPKRPRIVVTNWWTGAYRVEDENGSDDDRGFDARFAGSPQGFAAAAAGISDAAARGDARMFRQHARALRHQAAAISQKVGSGAISARRAAREQIRAARQRAREIQSRAHAHRKHVALARHPSVSPWLFVIGFFTLTLLAGGLFVGFLGSYRSAHNGATAYASARPGMPLLLVLEGADPADPRVQQRLDRIVVERRARGFDVITTTAGDVDLRNLINQWWHDPKGSADAAIENLLEAKNAYGLLHVTVNGDERRPLKNVREQVVYSTRKDASSRRRLLVETSVPDGPAPELPYLLINDHPAKTDPKVEAVVQQALSEYKARGWQLQSNDDVEVDVRKWLPPGRIEAANLLPPMLHEVLAKADMGGVLRIDALPGDGDPQERVIVTIVRREHVPEPAPIAIPASAETSEAPTQAQQSPPVPEA